MSKPKPPAPPDYSGVAQASKQATKINARLAQRQLKWAKHTYRKDKKDYRRVIDRFLKDQKVNSQNAAEDRKFFEQNYRPLELEMIKDAKTYDSPERRLKEMGASQALVAEQFNAQRDNAQRELEAYGIDPTSARYGALDIGVRAAQAAAQAAAGTTASNRVEDVGRAMRADAVNVGRGYGSSIAQTYGTAHAAGANAGQLHGQQTSIGGQIQGTAPQYRQLSNSAIDTWGNTLNMQYQNQLAAYNAEQQASSGWGSALGLVAGIGTKAFGFEDGGPVPEGVIPEYDLQMEQGPDGTYIDPGMSPSQGQATDDVPARLNAGEFVIPDDVVSWFGQKHMYGLIEKAKKEREETLATTQAIPDVGPPLREQPVVAT